VDLKKMLEEKKNKINHNRNNQRENDEFPVFYRQSNLIKNFYMANII